MTQTECNGCGLSVYDLPHEACDPEIVIDLFFEIADDGHIYCQGCYAAGLGVFPVSDDRTSTPADAAARAYLGGVDDV